MKNWINRHETTLAIIASTITIIAVLVGAMWTVQADYNQKFIDQQKQFNTTLEKIAEVEKQSMIRDHNLELELAKINK